MFDIDDVDEAKRMLPIYKRAVDLLETVSGKKAEQACARAKMCYGCGKALDEANASWMSHEELKAYWSGYGNGKQKALSEPVAFIGQGLIPIVPEDLEKLRKYEPGTATLYDTPLYAAPVSAEAIRADQRQKDAAACYLRANSWKDNAARAAKLCGDAIMAGVQT